MHIHFDWLEKTFNAGVAVATLFVLVKTWKAAVAAADAARDQASAARGQVQAADAAGKLAEQQLAAAKDAAAAEREHSRMLRRQTLAELRPILVFENGSLGKVSIQNESSSGIALDVEVEIETSEGLKGVFMPRKNVLGPGKTTVIEGPDLRNYSQFTLLAHYRSNDGRRFQTTAYSPAGKDYFVHTFKRMPKRI